MQPSRPSRTTPFLSTLSLRRATLMWWQSNTTSKISIHALLAESDSYHSLLVTFVFNFYPRSPCGERRQATYSSADSCIDFYPRSPCGERLCKLVKRKINHHFYPRSPCGERRRERGHVQDQQADFYPRSPCGERLVASRYTRGIDRFLSTLSLRRATDARAAMKRAGMISIHALLAESDNIPPQIVNIIIYFYPRSPCGERLKL